MTTKTTRLTFLTGSTALVLDEDTKKMVTKRVYGGETYEVEAGQAADALAADIALKANTKEAKAQAGALLAAANPATRRQNLDAKTPGLAGRMAKKKALEAAGAALLSKGSSKLEKLGDDLGAKGPKKEPDGKD